jgi:putative glutamine amidotransferase
VYLPVQEDVDALADRLDGLLLPGGGDFLPDRRYPAGVAFDPVPARQIRFDRALLAAALERDRPVLAICYGMQLLALHCGGALHFDVATDVPGAGEHRLADPGARHPIRIDSRSRLGALLGAAELFVNSRHHQAVADAGCGAITARTHDGVVEAIEVPGARFALGVQWHPESLDEEHGDRLFAAFVAACGDETPPAGGGSGGSEY